MRHTRSFLLGTSLALASLTLAAQVNTGGTATTANHTKQIVGYITQWDAWKTTTAGLPSPGALTHLNIDYSKYTILNFSFFGVAVDGSLHSGDHRSKQIYQQGVNQPPADIFFKDPYSSWDLHILFGELDLVNYINADVVKRATAQGFQVTEGGSTWTQPTWGLSGSLPLPLHKETGAPGLLALAHQKGVKVMASIGGWSMCKHFPEMAADPAKRKRFVADCVKLINTGFDGIDLDWEYPGPYSGMNFTGTAADYGNFLTLVREIRAAIGPNKLITAALSADPAKLQGFDWPALNGVMDYFNFMTYDYNGGWSSVAGHNSPQADYPSSEATTFNYEGLLAALRQLQVPLAKANFGVPFYGRGVVVEAPSKVGAKTLKRSETVQPDGPIVTAADYTNWPKDVYDGTPNYEFIRQVGLGASSGWTRGVDASAKVPYLTKGTFFLSYDDADSVASKAAFIKQNGLAGSIVWTVYGDLQFGGTATSFGTKLKRWSDVKSPLVNRLNEAFAGGSTNILPQVRLTSPLDNTTVKPGDAVTLVANATDADGQVVKVEYFDGTTRLGETPAQPHQWTVTNVSQGTHTYTAKATDNAGGSAVSAPVRVVAQAGGLAPTVVITSPASGATVVAGANLPITVNAADSDGTVTKVSFYQGTTLLGESSTAPFTFTWNAVPLGSYSLKAVATDNTGLTGASPLVPITVTSTTNKPPVVSITAPANNGTFKAPATFTVTVSASDPEGKLAKVELFRDGATLGAKTTAPFSWTVSALGGATYPFTAKATDVPGLTPTSSPVKVIVSTVVVQPWKVGVAYKIGDQVSYNGKTWTCKYAHTSNSAWYPGAPGLWFWV